MPDIPDEAVRAFRAAHEAELERLVATHGPDVGETIDLDTACNRAGLAAALRVILAAAEAPDSRLCDCPRREQQPVNPIIKAPMDHHCDCAAVWTAAILLGSEHETVHAGQCCGGCWTNIRKLDEMESSDSGSVGTSRDFSWNAPNTAPRKGTPMAEPNFGLDFLDFPTAWWLAARVEHPNPKCSYAQTGGGLLCDCGAIQAEWKRRRDAEGSDG